jgi:hypothetical protein
MSSQPQPCTFGEALKRCRLERGYTVHGLSKYTGAAASAIESWERDESRPVGQPRARLFGCLPHLKRWRALLDQPPAAPPTASPARGDEMDTQKANGKANGMNGHGTHHHGSAHERLAWAQGKWREDPDIPIAGAGGMLDMLSQEFGASASVDALKVARSELRQELARARTRGPLTATLAERASASKPPTVAQAAPKPPPLDSELGLGLGRVIDAGAARKVLAAAPAPAPEPSPAPAPELPAVDGRSRTSPEHRAVREAYARSIARPEMGVRDMRAALGERFGCGITDSVASEILRAAGRDLTKATAERMEKARAAKAAATAPDGHSGYEYGPEGAALRVAYARSIVRPKWTRAELVARVKRKFRIGLDTSTALTILSEARGGKRRGDYRGTPSSGTASAPSSKPAARATSTRDSNRYHEQQIRAAIELLFSEVPGLRELHVTREPGQKPRATFTLDRVETGSIEL